MTKFCIFGGARTGSTTFYEFFNDIGLRMRFEPFRPSRWKREKLQLDFELKEIYKRSDGIKHLWDHLLPDENVFLLEWFAKNDIKVLYLRRQNVFWQALSRAIAMQTGFWGSNNQNPERKMAYELLEMHAIPISTIKDYIQMTLLANSLFPNIGKSLQISYEDFFFVDEETKIANIRPVFEFLDLEFDAFAQKTLLEHFDERNKTNNFLIFRKIPNWDEIKEVFEVQEDEIR